MTGKEITALDEFLRGSATWPQLLEPKPSFFSLAKIDQKELPLSNTYAFFFDSAGPHGLGDAFIKALFDVLKQKKYSLEIEADSLGRIHAEREYPIVQPDVPTKWLDLLLHNGHRGRPIPSSASFTVLVEIKVWHDLHNDLDAYWEAIPLEPKRGIVLGFRREINLPDNWVFVSHLELALAIEQHVKELSEPAKPYYQPVLQHFLDHLKHMSGAAPESFSEVFAYAQRHRPALKLAQQLLTQLQPAWLAEVITAAFGDDYARGAWFDDRVHITPKNGGCIDYLVWFGHLLQMDAPTPSFSITLFPTGDAELSPDTRASLVRLFERAGHGVHELEWFRDDWYHEMIVGKDYVLQDATLDGLKSQIEDVLREDWLPLQERWGNLASLPTHQAPQL